MEDRYRQEYARRVGQALGWLFWGASALFTFVTLALTPSGDWTSQAIYLAQLLLVGTVSLIILLRSANHRIGWLLLAIFFLGVLMEFSHTIVDYSYFYQLEPPPALLQLAGWFSPAAWPLFFGLIFLIFPQIFPSGRPMPGIWTKLFRLTVGFITGFSLLLAFGTSLMDYNPEGLSNPYLIFPLDQLIERSILEAVFTALLLGITFLSVASLVIRARRSRGKERQQIKWITLALGILITNFIVASIYSIVREGECCGTEGTALVFQVVETLVGFAIPVAIGISILRYHLFDIDRLIKRTFTYGLLTGALLTVYISSVAIIQPLLPSDSPVVIVVSTLAMALLFNPLRRRIQDYIDRRFYRSTYNAAEVLAGFAAQAQEAVDMNILTSELLTVVGKTLQPESLSLWLRELD